jgi:soluble P-type ATPase
MTLTIAIPGLPELQIEHLMLDVNGTLTERGALLDGVHDRLDRLRQLVSIHLVSADTFGTLEAVAEVLGAEAVKASAGPDKLRELERLGPQRSVVIGNGANDVLVLQAAALGFAVLGPEGTSGQALRAADVVCQSAAQALELLLEPQALAATLRP